MERAGCDERIGAAAPVDHVALPVRELRRQAVEVVARDNLEGDALRVVGLPSAGRTVEDNLALAVEHVDDVARDAFERRRRLDLHTRRVRGAADDRLGRQDRGRVRKRVEVRPRGGPDAVHEQGRLEIRHRRMGGLQRDEARP